MDKIKRVQAAIARVSLVAAAAGLSTIAAAVFFSVLCRYVLRISAMWVEQYTRYMLIWVVFLAANVLIYRNSLMRVDFADRFWPKPFLKVREGLYTILFVVILCTLTWQGWLQAQSYWGVPVTGLPVDKFWVYLSVPVGSLLMLVQYLLNLAALLGRRESGGVKE